MGSDRRDVGAVGPRLAISRSSDSMSDEALLELDRAIREHGLVGDIVFDPPLSPEEQRRRYGLGMSMEERLELARRQIAEGLDES
jgi:hypothetical protein